MLQLVGKINWIESEGLVIRPTTTLSSTSCDIMYKKMCLSLETSMKLFAFSRNASSASLPCIHFMSMSFLNLSYENGFIN